MPTDTALPPITLETFWVFDRSHPFTRVDFTEQIGLLARCPDANWHRYDLNGMGLWREFAGTHLVVDMQSQRTALVRIDGDAGAMAYLALGKRGEPPTMIVRHTTSDLEGLRDWWSSSFAAGSLPIVRSGISPVSSRDAYQKSGRGMGTVANVDISCWWTAAPAAHKGLSHTASALSLEHRVEGQHRLVRLLEHPGAAYEDQWKTISTMIASNSA